MIIDSFIPSNPPEYVEESADSLADYDNLSEPCVEEIVDHSATSTQQDSIIEVYWDDEYDNKFLGNEKPGNEKSGNEKQLPEIKLYIFFLFMFQSSFHISDAAIDALLLFLSMFLSLLSTNCNSKHLEEIVAEMPQSTKAAKSYVSRKKSEFEQYSCCSKCFSIYQRGEMEVSKCSYMEFANHPQKQHRKICDSLLTKTIKTPSQRVVLVPKLIYCYHSVKNFLQEQLLRVEFTKKCELWRERDNIEGTYNDVYDGKVWRDFLQYDDKPFLSLPFNYALHLNVDWFQPFEHTQHSEGAIYLTILNLPREERYRQENVMLVGVIPGPHEPKLNINSFLEPLVEELLELWDGVIMETAQNVEVLVRAALICVACDIPAARKVCGFVGHGAYRGCSKCLLTFPTTSFGEKADYTNTD